MTPSLQPDQVKALLQATPGATVYLVGAGGCGMSGLGHLLLDLGHKVAGSDLVLNTEARQLRARGAQIRCGHDGQAVQAARPILLVHTPAVRPDNPELVTAQQMGVPVVRRAVLLAAILQGQRAICVTGMHGKTTTAAWLAFALERLGARPSYAIGALLPQLPRQAHWSTPAGGAAPWMVIEADESDGTLPCFHPEHAILLNVDREHLDHFAGLSAVCREFEKFASQVRGLRLYCKDDPHLCRLFKGQPRAVTFGFHLQAQYRVERRPRSHPTAAGGAASQSFVLWYGRERVGDFSTSLLGEKNVSNAAAVASLLLELGYPAAEVGRALAAFRGAARRQELLHGDARVRVYDDYGHHPSEIQATLKALREVGGRRLLVAFQPHRYTRTRHLLREFTTCFGGADELWLTEIYPANEPPIPGVSTEGLVRAIREQGQRVHYVPELKALSGAVLDAIEEGDVVLFLGAGDITKVAHEVAERCRAKGAGAGSRAGTAPASAPGHAGAVPPLNLWSPPAALRPAQAEVLQL